MDPSDPTRPRPEHDDDPEQVPWAQRLFDRPFVLLFLGIVIMAVFYTAWGLYEIGSLPPAPLP